MNNKACQTPEKKYKNRDAYINAAIEVVLDEGVEKFSLRKVASRLEVTPMAIYKHFPNKESILSAALDEFIFRAEVLPDQDMPWDDWLTYVATKMYEALSGDIVWTQALGAFYLGDYALQVTQAFIEKMISAGFSEERSVEIYLIVIQLVVGSASLRATLPKSPEEIKVERLDKLFADFANEEVIQSSFQEAFSDNFFRTLPFIISAIKSQ